MTAPTEIQYSVSPPDTAQEKARQGKSSSFFLSPRLEKVLRYFLLVPCLFCAFGDLSLLAHWYLFPFTIPKGIKPEALCGMAVQGGWMLLIAHFTILRSYGMAFLLIFPGLMLNAIHGRTANPFFWILSIVTVCAYSLMCIQAYRRRLERERSEGRICTERRG